MNDLTAPVGETFAAYFVKYLIARQGYKLGMVPELRPLAGICDYFLYRADRVNFAAVAIVDREIYPEKRFSPTAAEVQHLAEECLKYTGEVKGTKVPAVIRVYEIGPDVIDAVAIGRLTPYKRASVFSKAVVSAWLLDTAKGRAWTNMGLAALGPKRAAERLLRSPRTDQTALAQRQLAIAATPHPPYFTFALLALLVGIFAIEVNFNLDKLGSSFAPSLRTLNALGGLNRGTILEAGQWWRIFTAPLLHADLSHIGFNSLALFLIGRLLEPLIGWRWMAAVFAVSAVCGSLMSLAINPPNIIGIGASGGIVGLFAAGLVMASRVPAGPWRARLMGQAMYGLIPALLPFLSGAASGSHIDYGAHFGGAIGGVAMGLALLRLWPGQIVRPKWPNLGAAVAVVFFAVAMVAVVPASRLYEQQTLLIPLTAANANQLNTDGPRLARDYPHDPRARYANAMTLLRQNDMAKAEVELRAALAERDILRDSLDRKVEAGIRALLAVSLYEDGKKDEARVIALPACQLIGASASPDLLKKFSLCP